MDTHTALFAIDETPSRTAWPKHGYIIHFPGSVVEFKSPPVFSREAAIQLMDISRQRGILNDGTARMILRQIQMGSLPPSVTRWDRLFQCLSIDRPGVIQVFERLCGALPPEEGSGPARLEICTGHGACGLACDEFPKHGRLFILGDPMQYHLLFSASGAEHSLVQMTENGFYSDDERAVVAEQLAHVSLPDDEAAQQADRFNGCIRTVGQLNAYLPLIFGLRQPVKGPRFERCPDPPKHAHLFLHDEISLDEPVVNKYDAGKMFDEAVSQGLLRESQRECVMASLKPHRFPKGDAEHSLFETMRRHFAEEEAEHSRNDAFLKMIQNILQRTGQRRSDPPSN